MTSTTIKSRNAPSRGDDHSRTVLETRTSPLTNAGRKSGPSPQATDTLITMPHHLTILPGRSRLRYGPDEPLRSFAEHNTRAELGFPRFFLAGARVGSAALQAGV